MLDTLKYTEQLEQSGFTPEQAKAAITILRDSFEHADLVTKADLREAILHLENSLIRWTVTLMIAMTAIFGAIVKLF